jgi:hypothetical protein
MARSARGIASQWFAFQIDHGPPELVQHHPRRLVTWQSKLALQKQGGEPALVGGHQVRGPEPNRQRRFRIVQYGPGRRRNLVPTACTLPSSEVR